jgi:integrase
MPNVKSSRKYERFGETIRYLTVEELQRFFDSIDRYPHKLMLQMVHELGCRVGEFVRVRLRDLNFGRSSVFFPAENTKTKQRRTSHLPRGLMNELKSFLKAEGRITIRDERVKRPDDFLFHPPGRPTEHYSENRLRQIFGVYLRRAGLDRCYGQDQKGRRLHELTIHWPSVSTRRHPEWRFDDKCQHSSSSSAARTGTPFCTPTLVW